MRTQKHAKIITADNIEHESYHNLCRIQEQIEYADPIGAINNLRFTIAVTRDACGNITTAKVKKSAGMGDEVEAILFG